MITSDVFFKHKDVDWKELGLRCGVEIHQQLLTERKLFCRCPAGRYSDRTDARVVRHMRPTLSELGEYDGTALMEFKTRKNIMYLLDTRTVCTYEMDDTPPFEINREAVDIALEVAMALGCQIVGELHVIRKQYLDGSIPTGFQRTAIVGIDGQIPFRGRTIQIIQVSVEEDACREVSDRGHDVVFRTDRLSMPLCEIVTGPDMRTPEEAAEVVRLLGRVMRGTGRVRRGAGATREDVNVSVTGSTRVEMKGVPSIRFIPRLVGNESLRHRALLDVKEELERRGLKPEDIEPRMFDAADLLAGTAFSPIREALARGEDVRGVRLCGMRELLSRPVNPHRTVFDELAGRVRVIACIDEEPILLHNENVVGLGIGVEQIRAVRRRAKAKAQDAVIVLRGSPKDVALGLDEIVARVKELFAGVPSETRQVLPTMGTDFERILPGPDRMYPDTDSPPMSVPDGWLDSIRPRLKEPVWERDTRLAKQGLPPDMIEILGLHPRFPVYDRAVARGMPPLRVGELLTWRWNALAKAGVHLGAVRDDVILDLFAACAEGAVLFESLPGLLADAAADVSAGACELISRRGLKVMRAAEIGPAVRKALASAEAPRSADPEARIRHYMGAIMPSLRSAAPGKSVRDAVAASVGAAA
ncbi:MAG: Glu-tRNA(Gln) amidotransferase subunit GatE [Deltaproteobacteria bacterium]|nr:Glu-tRNA(Gln) amidotransferase subunit GatE [Deltaproteobacteria bacterium]